ncbi:MAG: rod-binding protein [Sulfurospirillum sp.]|nr:rod-binding protein [Sulfurospirillum sp.]MBL0703424.1 rod-binding protein [Sulfurospirillum sp.]
MIDNTMTIMNTINIPKGIDIENSTDTKLKEQTDKFEAFFIKQVLDISLKNDSKLFEKDASDKIYNSMYNDAMSNALTGKFGFSEMLFNFLKEER